jgi:fatty-acyl-CoA synthase
MTESTQKFPNFVEMYAGMHPDKPAVIGKKRTITWSMLNERSKALAKKLFSMGLRPGEQVSIMAYNIPECYEIIEAVNWLGCGRVMVGYRMKAPEIEYIVDHSDSKLLFFLNDFDERIVPYKENYKKLLPDGLICMGPTSYENTLDFEELFADTPDVDLNNLPPAEKQNEGMVYTSGTTGRPKGASRNVASIASEPAMNHMKILIDFLKYDNNVVHLLCCPIYHSGPAFFAFVSFMLGGTIVLQERFDPEEFLELVSKHGVTASHVVPTMVSSILDVSEDFTKDLDFSSLRSILLGAAPTQPKHKTGFIDRFGPVLYEYYGSTETGINTFITPEEIRQHPTSVGKAFPENEIILLDPEGKEVPDGEPGELYVHSPIMIDHYYKDDEGTREVHKGKYMTAGDIAIRDKKGYYYIVDRIKDMIIRGGVNIYPAEIESEMNKIPGIKEVAVVGKPDSHLGETVACFVVREKVSDVTEDIIKEYCADKMANQKIPVLYVFLDELPRNPTGKVLKRELRDSLKDSG